MACEIVCHRSPSPLKPHGEFHHGLLSDLDARYIGSEIDPATKLEKTFPITLPYIQSSKLMMLTTRHGFLDLFDYVPGHPSQDVSTLFLASIEVNGMRFASLDWLRKMKETTNREKDRIDLKNLPG